MSVFRVNKRKDFTVMSNVHLKDKRLSLKAIGLLSILLSLPEDWEYSIEGLVALCGIDGKTAVKSALQELKVNGYLNVSKLMPDQTTSGRIEYIYDIYEQPYSYQKINYQGTENLSVENQPQLNTNIQNTNIQSINKYIVEIVEYLNKKLGTNYRSTSQNTRSHIKARLEEGFKVDDFKKVIDIKYEEWKDTDMESYLRPQTLFGTKFESYLNQKRKTTSNNNKKPVYNDNEVILT